MSHRVRVIAVVACASAACAWLAACTFEPARPGVGGVCRRDRDCQSGLVCLVHQCERREAARDGGPSDVDAGQDAGPAPMDAGRDGGPPALDAGHDAGMVEMDAGRQPDAGGGDDAGGLPIDADLPDVAVPLDT